MSDPFPFPSTRSKPQNGALTDGDDNEAVDIELKRRQAVKCQRKAGRKFFPLLGKFIRKARAKRDKPQSQTWGGSVSQTQKCRKNKNIKK